MLNLNIIRDLLSFRGYLSGDWILCLPFKQSKQTGSNPAQDKVYETLQSVLLVAWAMQNVLTHFLP